MIGRVFFEHAEESLPIKLEALLADIRLMLIDTGWVALRVEDRGHLHRSLDVLLQAREHPGAIERRLLDDVARRRLLGVRSRESECEHRGTSRRD